MSNNKKRKKEWIVYCRSYLVTLGLFFSAVSTYVLLQKSAPNTPAGYWAFLIVMPGILISGIALVLYGFLGPSVKMQSWADSASKHWASIILMAVAYPIYLVMKQFYKET